MNQEEIEILLKHGDISETTHTETYPGFNLSRPFVCLQQEGNGEMQLRSYYINEQLYLLAKKIFEYYTSYSRAYFEEYINRKLINYSPLREDKKRFYADVIIAEYSKLKEIAPGFSADTPFIEVSLDMAIEYALDSIIEKPGPVANFLLTEGENFLHCLKFTVLGGGKIDDFKLPGEGVQTNLHKLDEYFTTPRVMKIRTVLAILNNIDTLKEMISDLDSHHNELSASAVAMLGYFKEIQLNSKFEIEEIVKKYDLKIKLEGTTHKNIKEKWREYNEGGLYKNLDNSNVIKFKIEALQMIFPYLNPKEEERVKNTIEEIKNRRPKILNPKK